jgi:hypothetical protein
MQKQDIEDRKSIGVFGAKKNSEILGNNSISVKSGHPNELDQSHMNNKAHFWDQRSSS